MQRMTRNQAKLFTLTLEMFFFQLLTLVLLLNSFDAGPLEHKIPLFSASPAFLYFPKQEFDVLSFNLSRGAFAEKL